MSAQRAKQPEHQDNDEDNVCDCPKRRINVERANSPEAHAEYDNDDKDAYQIHHFLPTGNKCWALPPAAGFGTWA